MARLKPQTTRPPVAPVRRAKPDPLLWEVALRLAKGDARRVELVSRTEAIIR